MALWTKIVESAGGKAEVKQATLPSTRTIDGLPPVTIAPVAAKSIGPLPSITVLRDGTVGFVSLGAPADRISTRGLGSDFPGYVPDHDPQGNLDPIPVAQNRQVIIELT